MSNELKDRRFIEPFNALLKALVCHDSARTVEQLPSGDIVVGVVSRLGLAWRWKSEGEVARLLVLIVNELNEVSTGGLGLTVTQVALGEKIVRITVQSHFLSV